MNEKLLKLYETSPKLLPKYISEVLRLHDHRAGLVSKITGGISKPEAELLCQLVSELQPTISLEVGLGYGFSALAICTSCDVGEGRKHIVIDPHQDTFWNDQGLKHLKDAGFSEMIELHREKSYLALPKLLNTGVKIDFAFIDGWHTFDYVMVDFFYIDKLLKTGGIVAFDDADWKSIRPLIRYIVTNLNYSIAGTLPEKFDRDPLDIKLKLEGSCIALRKENDTDKREIFYHQSFF